MQPGRYNPGRNALHSIAPTTVASHSELYNKWVIKHTLEKNMLNGNVQMFAKLSTVETQSCSLQLLLPSLDQVAARSGSFSSGLKILENSRQKKGLLKNAWDIAGWYNLKCHKISDNTQKSPKYSKKA